MKFFDIIYASNQQAKVFKNQHNDLQNSYAYYGIEAANSNGYSNKEITDYIRNEIINLLQSYNITMIRKIITILKVDAFFSYISEKKDISEPLAILSCIEGCCRKIDVKQQRSHLHGRQLDRIKKVCFLASQYCILTGYFTKTPRNYKQIYRQELLEANITHRIKLRYPDCKLRHGKVKNSSQYIDLLITELEQTILKANPEYVMFIVYSMYYESYDPKLGLFSSPKNGNHIRKYLLNLSAKLASNSVPSNIINKALLSEIFDLADIIVSSYDPFIHSQFQYMSMSNEPINDLHKMMLIGAIVTDQQYHPHAIRELVAGCFNNFDTLIKEETYLSLNTILSIHEAITTWFCNVCESNKYLSSFKLSRGEFIAIVQSYLPELSARQIKGFYNRFVCSEPINKLYFEPHQMEHIDLDSKYLFCSSRNKNKEIYFPLLPLSSFGLFEELADIAKYDSRIGFNFESFIRTWFERNFKCSVYSGKYILDNVVYETDGILIQDKDVIILECKRKSLTRKARAGHVGKLLVDLSQAFLDSALQAYRCEAAIRLEKCFKLYPPEASNKEILKGTICSNHAIKIPEAPQFYRLSLTPYNFGIVSEAVICHNILGMCLKYRFDSPESDIRESLQKITTTMKKINDIWDRIKDNYVHGDSDYFHNVVFNTILLSFNTLYFLTSLELSEKPPLNRIRNYLHVQSSSYNYMDIIKTFLP
ncbi:MAG: hypothetical protein H6Q69_76 [Firmicutes bacterium]|nr:hypothetical protein [Bacillota bacterium]